MRRRTKAVEKWRAWGLQDDSGFPIYAMFGERDLADADRHADGGAGIERGERIVRIEVRVVRSKRRKVSK
ncbi:MAG: hypothetical protein JNK15_23685 [Planctomycetes bacterium]|nr:hypothetical protein [Planctomycetota bacterium]